MTKILDLPTSLEERRMFGFLDDFEWFLSPHRFTSVISDAGSASAGDAAAGRLAIVPSDGTVADNDEAYVKGRNESYVFAADKPILFETRVQFTEANADDANVIAGLMDAVAADALLDNGGGPKASYSGMVFFKEDGQTLWSCESSVGGVQTTTQLSAAGALDKVPRTAGGSAWQVLRIEFRPISPTLADVLFFVDGQAACRQSLSFTGATEMQVVMGVKNGGANLETLNVDYVGAWQLR